MRASPRPPQLRPLNQPRALQVRCDDHHTPMAVALPADGRTFLEVAAIRERWRIDDEWWRNRISRLYYVLVLEKGQLMSLYRDLENGRWFLQG